ncbi:MAG: glycosyltransferase [Cyclobacteriaceae bacterium]
MVTFEQEQYEIHASQIPRIKKELATYGIYWYPLKFHSGSLLLLKKAYDFIQALMLIVRLRLLYNTKLFFSLANVSASIAIVLKKMLCMKMLVYSYEPHAEFMVDLGLWSRRSLKFKVLNYLETLAGQKAEFVLTGTKHMVERLNALGSSAKVVRAPTAVDSAKFQFTQEGRDRIRSKFNMQHRKVFLYMGKFGDLYYTHEIAELFNAFKLHIPDAFLMIITSTERSSVDAYVDQYVSDDDLLITGNLPYEEMSDYLSSADIGISGVPPAPSQRYRSPTKVAEYLLCGLPYITTKGVSEDDEYALKCNVGVVVENFSYDQANNQVEAVRDLLMEDHTLLRSRCRKVALEYRSIDRIDKALLDIYNTVSRTS